MGSLLDEVEDLAGEGSIGDGPCGVCILSGHVCALVVEVSGSPGYLCLYDGFPAFTD